MAIFAAFAAPALLGAAPRSGGKCVSQGAVSTRTPSACAAGPGAARLQALRGGVECALDDYVTSGSNVAVGGGDGDAVRALVQALSARVETGALLDSAFVPVSSTARDAIEEFSLPTDASINHGALDVYLGCVSQLDGELNAALTVPAGKDAGLLRTERVAAQLATHSVLLIHEADYAASASGLASFPVALDPLFVKRTAQDVRGNETLSELGIRALRERGDGSNIADVLMVPSSDILSIDSFLSEIQGVHAVGVVPTSPTVTAVIAAETEAYDVTSSLAGIVNLSNGVEASSPDAPTPVQGGRKALAKLTSSERREFLKQLGPAWSIRTDGRECLQREFRFASPEQSHAFVFRILRVARMAKSYPEVTSTFNRVHVRLSTLESQGVTKLDVAIAREIGMFCDLLHGCTTV